jgi:hypothetical protein
MEDDLFEVYFEAILLEEIDRYRKTFIGTGSQDENGNDDSGHWEIAARHLDENKAHAILCSL